MKRLMITLVCAATLAGAGAVINTDSASTPSLTPQREPARPSTLGPVTQIAHIYGNNVICSAFQCTQGETNAFMELSDLNAPVGEEIVPASVAFDIVDFDLGGVDDALSWATVDEIEVVGKNAGCHLASPGDVLATVTGEFTGGDTFSIQVIAG
ncbi:MAG: hypothetical protein GY708_00700 [Actinomycetia bacterium]|nr:hypothetical protein [Actinomycetes bacterium]